MKILIADDDEIVRAFVQRVVEHASHHAVVAEDGRQALALVESVDPDMLITDLRMPEMDGFALIDAVRALPRYARLPVICLSAVNQRDDVARMIQMGISDYVLKPVKPGDLAERIRAVSAREKHWKLDRELDVVTARTASP